MLPERLPIREVPEHLPAFVNDVLLTTLTSAGKKTVWCVKWQEHPDAVTRLAAIADAWNHMLGADSESGDEEDADLHAFLREVLDHHLPLLVDNERGAFAHCGYGHRASRRLDADAVAAEVGSAAR